MNRQFKTCSYSDIKDKIVTATMMKSVEQPTNLFPSKTIDSSVHNSYSNAGTMVQHKWSSSRRSMPLHIARHQSIVPAINNPAHSKSSSENKINSHDKKTSKTSKGNNTVIHSSIKKPKPRQQSKIYIQMRQHSPINTASLHNPIQPQPTISN